IDMVGFSYQTLGLSLEGGRLTSSTGPATLTAPTYTLNGGLIDTNVSLGGTGVLTQIGGVTDLRGTVATPNVSITGGTLRLDQDQRLSAATNLNLASGTFDLNGFSQTLSNLNGNGRLALSSDTTGGSAIRRPALLDRAGLRDKRSPERLR